MRWGVVAANNVRRSASLSISPDEPRRGQQARTVQSERDFRRNACNGLESHMRADKKLPYISSRSDAGRAERAQPGRPFGVPEPPYCRWEGAGRPLERLAPLSPHPRRCPPQVRRTTGWICVQAHGDGRGQHVPSACRQGRTRSVDEVSAVAQPQRACAGNGPGAAHGMLANTAAGAATTLRLP